MIECPYCYRVFRQAPEKMGARCPKCRMALYEDPGKRRKTFDKDLGPCMQHPDLRSVTKCSRCDRLLCQSCRTRWQEEIVCPQCVDQSIADDEPSPREAHMQTRQAWVGVILGSTAWMVLLLTLGPLSAFQQTPVKPTIIFLTYFCFLGSLLPGIFALGHAISALRLRGDHAKLALGGLVCAGSQVGLVLGIIVLNLWHN